MSVTSDSLSTKSDSDDETDTGTSSRNSNADGIMLIAGYVAMNYGEKYLKKKKMRQPLVTGQQWVNGNLATNKDCYKMFRMYRPCFDALHATLVQHYNLKSTRDMSSVETLRMFLWTVGAPQSVSQVENRFKRSTETIHQKFKEVLDCLNHLAGDNIRPSNPEFTTIHERLQDSRFSTHFNDCIGAIDGTHVPVVVPADEIVNHVGRHGYPTQNVMVVCDFDMRFTSIVAGWPGSVHDTRIFKDTLTKYSQNFPHPPAGI